MPVKTFGRRNLTTSVLVIIPLLAFGLSAFFCAAYSRYESSGDQNTYVFMARLFSAGHLSAPEIEGSDHLTGMWQIHKDERVYGKYAPLWPILLGVGFIFNAEWIVNPLIGAFSILLILLIGRELNFFWAGVVAALLIIFSPFWFIHSVKYFPHPLATLFLLLSFYFFVRYMLRRRLWNVFWIGAGLGVAFSTRYIDALAFGPVIAIFIVLYVEKKFRPKAILKAGGVFLLGFMALAWMGFAYNMVLSGSPFTTGYQVIDGEKLEFIPTVFMNSLTWYKTYFDYFSRMFAGSALAVIIFLAFAFLDREQKYFVRLLLLCSLGLLVIYSAFPNHSMGVLGGGYLGPRYFHFLVVTFGLSIAISLDKLSARKKIFACAAGILIALQIGAYFVPFWAQQKKDNMECWRATRKILNQARPGSLVFTNVNSDYLVHLHPDLSAMPVIFIRDTGNKRLFLKNFPVRKCYVVDDLTLTLKEVITPPVEALRDMEKTNVEKYLKRYYPATFTEESSLIMVWECRNLDGIVNLIIKDAEVMIEDLKYSMPQDVQYRFYDNLNRFKRNRVDVIKDIARGDVKILDRPREENGYSMTLQINDEMYGGGDDYRIFVVVDDISRRAAMTGEIDPGLNFDFETGDYRDWEVKGSAFGTCPSFMGQWSNSSSIKNTEGRFFVNSLNENSDKDTGEMISKPFIITGSRLEFLIGGGNHPGETCINLVIGGRVVLTETGRDSEILEREIWDVSPYIGETAIIQIVDKSSSGWGHILIDHILMSR